MLHPFLGWRYLNVADTAIDEGIRAVDRGVKHLVILVSMESEPFE